MSRNFPEIDEQLTYIKKGAAEIIREGELREKLVKSRTMGRWSCCQVKRIVWMIVTLA